MTSKGLLKHKIGSILYWAEELKAIHDELKNEEGAPNYDDLSWVAYIMISRGKEIREMLRDDEFKN